MRKTIISCIAILSFACNAGKKMNDLPVAGKPLSRYATPLQSNYTTGANANLLILPENKSLAGKVAVIKKLTLPSLPKKLRRPAVV